MMCRAGQTGPFSMFAAHRKRKYELQEDIDLYVVV